MSGSVQNSRVAVQGESPGADDADVEQLPDVAFGALKHDDLVGTGSALEPPRIAPAGAFD
jgi:hypothetical protein